jgi:hypothetical protein
MQQDRRHVASPLFQHFFRSLINAEGNVSTGGNNLATGHDPTT